MKRLLFSIVLATLCLTAGAREARHIFHNAYEAIPDKAAVFKVGECGFPYPAYKDRDGWDKLLGDRAISRIKRAEKYLDWTYTPAQASDWLLYEKIQERKIWNNGEAKNRTAFDALVMGELAEGKGRFIPKIIDGIFYFSNLATWSHPQHTTNQDSHRTLPDPDDRFISLLSAHNGERVALAWHFLHEEFDKVDPVISKMALSALDKNIFTPYLDREKQKNHTWMALYNRNRMVNNWNTECNTYILEAFLLACQDEDRLLDCLDIVTESVDMFMDYVKMDGACEEGPSYWGMAGAKAYEFTKMLWYASKGKINLLNDIQLRRMGEWKAAIDAGDEWLVAFGDGFARSREHNGLVYRFGKDVGSRQMMDLALYQMIDFKKGRFNKPKDSGFGFRPLEAYYYFPEIEARQKELLDTYNGDFTKIKAALTKNFKSLYYEETEFASLRNSANWLLGAKGGNNGESHNHNDLGSGVLFINECPVLIDPGVSTYGPRFYEGKQYGYWNKESRWHNTPTINGVMQSVSKKFYATDSRCDIAKGIFHTDIAHAYGEKAACEKWARTYTLGKDVLTISDEFKLSERKAADIINFIAQGNISLPGEKIGNYSVKNGEVIIAVHNADGDRNFHVRLTFPKSLTPAKEILKLKDPRFVKVWGDKIEKLTLTTAGNAPVSGKYTYTVKVTNL